MSLSFARKTALCGILIAGIPALVFGQTNYYATNGIEYPIVGSLAGDQVHPETAINANGGFVVWQDNATDGSGWGVSAMRLNSTLSGSGSSFRVDGQGSDDQENPRVALLQNGGAVFVWQGGPSVSQHIYARFLGSNYTWSTGDILVNTFTNNPQITPDVTALANGNVVVVWASFNEAGSTSMQDVYGRIFSPAGTPVSGEFLINQFTTYNQRTPAVAALADGGFVVAWVSEQQRSVAAPTPTQPNGHGLTPDQQAYPSVDIYARQYDANGNPKSGEFLVNADFNPCANPDVAAGSDGGFVITWCARDMTSPYDNGLDIYACSFSSVGAVVGTVMRVNTHLYGDQYAPRVAALGIDYLIVWTSLAQDGSREGVYGRFLRGNGSMVGSEFRVNSTTISSQFQPAVASDGTGQFLTIWSSFTGLPYSFDLFAQRYVNTQQPLEPLPAPFVWAPFVVSNGVYQPQLVVSWPPVTGISVSNYEIYINGASTPSVVTTGNVWTMTAANGLTTSSSNYFQVSYVTTDGRHSPLSPPAGGTTWNGYNWAGIPFEWMTQYYGSDLSKWPGADTPVASGGPTLLQVFLSGGDPLDSSTWLRTALSNTPEGLFLSWNPQPGFTYQVQVSTNLSTWSDLGAPRFAADTTDSIFVGESSAGYYRVLLLRQ